MGTSADPSSIAVDLKVAAAPVLPMPSPGPALRDYALAELEAAVEALGQAGDDIHEGIHRARKGLRRVRATLALGDGILGPGVTLIDREIKHLNTGLSGLRDAHALVETLGRMHKRARKDDTRQLFAQARADAIAARTAITEVELSMDPALGQRRGLIEVLAAAVPALDWERLTPSASRMALADSDDRSQEARDIALRTGRDNDWHRWRRRARRASQQRRALEAVGVNVPASGPEVFDKRTTERLGEAQDLTLLLDHCGKGSPFSKEHRRALRAYAEPALARLRKRISTVRR
ncbi:CHAD domain-containing protein [Lysobacter arenosi]|uniref:CHAD domain-containing protein n=1 Tax=Lysobacter arenosi TaxID=2795387 RepID=A0ABX7RA02_9GAMM|nr:CHAD domain-containing protein [Lysobacter arenosi]QSX74151.1 CHAD domain-containing protein [Lysobacter arenosi]